ncbi:YusW family protein [Planococcus lenghuensis]|uniref:YusW-like protein n=1 Tax=Planococcus lenghuensis TaxID=2213202 RepID=A0A1Q2L1Q3_9BACL|nr:YusW family protein [Planococcus lenghuensis]AQQ54369.1 hypothetical protein B0X71_15515 [Planococcus lenghuensis]
MGRNKYRFMAGIAISSVMVLGACDRGDVVTEHVGDESPTPANTPEEADPAGGVDEPGGVTFGFTDFVVEAEFAEGEELYASYEEERDQVVAEYRNDLEGETFEGNEAWDELEPVIEGIEIDPETPDEEVIASVMDAFELGDNVTSLTISVTYEDGTDEEYELEE